MATVLLKSSIQRLSTFHTDRVHVIIGTLFCGQKQGNTLATTDLNPLGNTGILP